MADPELSSTLHAGGNRFVDTSVAITGGASGIGRATALQFAREGARVAIIDLNGAESERVRDELCATGATAVSVSVDVTDSDQVSAAFASVAAAIGPPDVLVNNAAVAGADDVLVIEPDRWRADLASTLDSAFLCVRAVLPEMIARGSGSIVNVSSVNALVGLGGEAYSAGKAGLISLTQNIAVRFGKFGIRANAVAPGSVRTPIWGNRLEDAARSSRLLAMYPLGRFGEPDDVAAAILFLSSSAAAWITGAVLPVDGGLTAGGAFHAFSDDSPTPDLG